MSKSVKATRKKDYDDCENPGDFYITAPNPYKGGVRHLSFLCPCGCCCLCGIKIRDDGQNTNGAWGWDKNEEQPTCTPSIRINGEHWHGYLTKGVFEPC